MLVDRDLVLTSRIVKYYKQNFKCLNKSAGNKNQTLNTQEARSEIYLKSNYQAPYYYKYFK